MHAEITGTEKPRRKREPFPDIVRGFAILLVCFGHCIQMGSGGEYFAAASYFDSRVYQFIYSFHMPLFMLLSGWFGAYSMEHARAKGIEARMLGRRTFALLFPVLFWDAFNAVTNFLMTVPTISRDDPVYDLKIQWLARHFLGGIPSDFFTTLWFLWAVWWAFVLIFAVRRFGRDHLAVYAAVALLGLVTPDGLNFGVYKYVFPYYLLGYLAARPGREGRWFRKYAAKAAGSAGSMLAAGAVFVLLFVFFRRSILIYESGFRIEPGSGIHGALVAVAKDAYRFLIGLAGCIFFLLLLYRLWRATQERLRGLWTGLAAFGRHSMGIYILSTYWIVWLINPLTTPYRLSYGWNLAETAFVAAASLVCAWLLEKVPLLRHTVGS